MNIIHNIFYKEIYVNLSIGTPPQIIPFSLNINSQTFSVPNNIFHKNKSSSYESISKSEIPYENEDVIYGFISKDVLNINNKTKNKKIDFILGTKYRSKDNILGTIGLLIPKKEQDYVFPFLNTLHLAGYINSYTWTLKYFNNISLFDFIFYNQEKNNLIGEFIIGDEPHNYESNKQKYNKTEYLKVSPLSSDDSLYWDIEFKSIFLLFHENEINKKNISKININGNKRVEIIPNNLIIIATEEFYNQIKKFFFQNYFELNICREKLINNYFYRYIECNNTSLFEINSFPNICFEHKGFETIFNLTYKDLFILDKINNKYIFLIFNRRFFSGWVFGSIFLKKYQLIFNLSTFNK